MAKKTTIKFKGIEFEEVSRSEWNAGTGNYMVTRINGETSFYLQKKTKRKVVKG